MPRLLFLLLGFLQPATVALAGPAEAPPWTMVWSDEFEVDGAPDPGRWSYDVGGHGWGNKELQFYTDDRRENARVEAGHLIIEAHREPWENSAYTSARLVTKGKGDWTHGRFEIRARLPDGRGTWPAIWMLPTTWDLGDGKWPDNGEIDIMEHVGHDLHRVHASTHTQKNQWKNNTQRTAAVTVPDATTAFHTYALEWDENEIRMFVDDRHYFTSRKEGADWTAWPFFRDFHLVLNVAVGGDWGAIKGIDTDAFPQRLVVDYVRVYRAGLR
ncbi:MAG: glycoside hydrolase family 16 protein [Candidatus Didemnitutus sp.]|nr:glycoside hydrolase family 16 protein [Candidatus Didemnitutus sp.]